MNELTFKVRNGYSVVGDGFVGDEAYMHRLLAVSEYGLDAVDGHDVHHKNGLGWDNRPQNIELHSRSGHLKKEWDKRGRKLPDDEKIFELYFVRDMLQREIAEMYGATQSAVSSRVNAIRTTE